MPFNSREFDIVKAAVSRNTYRQEQHQDDAAVDALAAAMKAKLAKQRANGYGGWDMPECTQQRLSDMLRAHVDKGDPVDVANFCAFLAARGEGIAQAAPAAVAVPSDWRERFAEAVYQDLAAADNQDVPLEDYPTRILKVLDSVVGPRHPTVVQWRNDAINTCIATAYKYCRDPESFQYLKQDLQALITAPQPPAQAPTESVLIDGIAYDTPAPVAAELLRLNIEAKQPAPVARGDAEVPSVSEALMLKRVADAEDTARWRWLSSHIMVAWNEGRFTSLVRIVSDENRASLNASVDRMMGGDWCDVDAARSQAKEGGA